jgi:alkylation response protein AidB-like acyl-CoA dehydrogenase
VTGNKTWITHPVRADVMTLLARTNPDEQFLPACPCSWPKSRAARRQTRSRPKA